MSVQNPEDGFHIAHFGAKWVIEEAIRQSGNPVRNSPTEQPLPKRLLVQRYYSAARYLSAAARDIGVSRVDVRDIAKAAYNCLTSAGHGMNAWYEQWFMVAPPGGPVVEGK
jgi:hypothetical protein